MVNLLQQFSHELALVAANARTSLVRIAGDQGNLGAGTIWHSDGLIITNAHVVSGGQFSVILSNGDLYPAQRVAYDRDQDLAAIAIPASDLPTIPVGDSRQVRTGEWVIALGHPWGVRDSLTAGSVIGMGANLPELPTGREWLALSLHLRPGHSGGALLNVDGQLIGINTMITGPEVGFAIPSHVVKSFLKQHMGLAAAS
ncbi:MAG: S1C family serine protease [Anaerolineae bacterium]|jgi:S1-C subfamily serine protease|nr:S1C family serine protease [Anaerolineae bacterium]